MKNPKRAAYMRRWYHSRSPEQKAQQAARNKAYRQRTRLDRNATMRAWRFRNRVRLREQARQDRKRLPYTEAERRKRHAQLKAWKARNRQHIRTYTRRRYATDVNARAKVIDRSIKRYQKTVVCDCSAKIAALMMERFCRWCCCVLTTANREIDHIVPLARGGRHHPDNLCASCKRCNRAKRHKLVEEWLPTLKEVSI
jgi:hypothetical protein